MQMDFSKAFKKPFTDIGKLVIGLILSIFPIISWFTRGFIFECSGLGRTKKSDNMPEWKNWGDLFFKGFVSRVVGIIYLIPAGIVFFIGVGRVFTSFILPCFPSNFPFMAGGFDPGPCIEQNIATGFPQLLGFIPYVLLTIVLVLLAAYLLPFAILNFIKTGKVGSAFELSNISKMAFTGDYFVVWLLTYVVGLILGALLFKIVIIGPAFAFFVVNVFAYTLYGDVYRNVSKKK